MGIALENARLFDETQRLLKETEQRAPSCGDQQRPAWPLRRASTTRASSIWSATSCASVPHRRHRHPLARPEHRPHHYLYDYRSGARYASPRRRAGAASAAMVHAAPWSRHRRRSGEGTERDRAGHDETRRRSRARFSARSRVLGAINLWNDEREHAYGPRQCAALDVAASMGVALENARLFDETQRLLKETEQRAAELAVINSIQRGMAEKLDFQQIVDLVGDKLGEVTSTGNVGIRIYDPVTNQISFRTSSRTASASRSRACRYPSAASGRTSSARARRSSSTRTPKRRWRATAASTIRAR
jgi:hypothetical protein